MLDKVAVRLAIDVYEEDALEFVRLTLKDADAFVGDIVSRVGQGDAQTAGLAAHSLKSIMRQIGAEDVGSVAYEIEKAGKAGLLDVCRDHLHYLNATYAEARDYLASLLS